MQVHKRQWLISRRPELGSDSMSPSFRTLEIGPGVFLHYDRTLNVSCVGSSLILGTVLGAYPDREHYFQTGRFVCIEFPMLYLDATALMGVYYFPDRHDIICASSQALVGEIIGAAPKGKNLVWKRGLNWDPLPAARLPGLRKLFCDQALHLETQAVVQKPRVIRTQLTESEAVHQLGRHLVDLARRLAAAEKRILLALTGGRDSRTILSALIAGGTKFSAFTWVFDGSSRLDAESASRLCSEYGIEHQAITPTDANPDGTALYSAHTAGAVDDADGNVLIPRGLYRNFRSGDVILMGGIFEIGRRYYAQQFKPAEHTAVTADDIAIAFDEVDSTDVRAATAAWLKYRSSNPIVGMDVTDTFYLDQRLGGWLASICQGEDIQEPEFINLANSWTCIEFLMSTTLERRMAGVIQTKVMDELVPGLSEVEPINRGTVKSRIKQRLRSALIGTSLEGAARHAARNFRRLSV